MVRDTFAQIESREDRKKKRFIDVRSQTRIRKETYHSKSDLAPNTERLSTRICEVELFLGVSSTISCSSSSTRECQHCMEQKRKAYHKFCISGH